MIDNQSDERSVNEDNDAIKSLSKELVNTSIDLSVDYFELGLDDVLNESILKEIPVFKTMYSVFKIEMNIKKRFFIKKFFIFLKEFHTSNINANKLESFENSFENDWSYRVKVTEYLMVYLDSFLESKKAEILARLFSSHVNGVYDWGYFISLSTCLDSINPGAYSFIKILSENNFEIDNDPNKRFMPRNGNLEALLYASGIAFEASAWASSFNVSKLGQDLFNYGIKSEQK